MTRPNLVITRAGPNSLHPHWLEPGAARNFDLLVSAYADGVDALGEGVFHQHLPGYKVAGWKIILEQQADLISRYRNIALIDDDIMCDAAAISACFDAGDRHALDIWQPGLSWDSYFTYAGTLANPRMTLRYVNFVEMMCPFFSASALRQVAPLFALGWESGIDLVWCSLLPDPWMKCAVIDSIEVRHTRPVGKEKDRNGFSDTRYEDAINACLAHFEMKWPSLIAYRGIDRRGKTKSQMAVALQTLSLMGASRKSPTVKGMRPILDHIRHQWTRKPWFNPRARAILGNSPY